MDLEAMNIIFCYRICRVRPRKPSLELALLATLFTWKFQCRSNFATTSGYLATELHGAYDCVECTVQVLNDAF